MISQQDLLHYNSLGLIPGPLEDEEAFLARVHYCLDLMNQLNSSEIPFPLNENTKLSQFSNANAITKKLYDISPEWIPIFFSNHQLSPWHGGCAWIFQLSEETPTAAFLQLRKTLQNSKCLFGFYGRDELIAHELAHVGRMVFEEPQFEEILAYQTSQSAFQRYFSPIVQSSIESFVFVMSIIGVLFLDFFLIMTNMINMYWHLMWFKLIPLSLIFLGTYRLWNKQRTFSACKKNIQPLLTDKNHALATLFRLTDEEIATFANMTTSEIKNYFEEHQENSLRLRLISLAYIEPT